MPYGQSGDVRIDPTQTVRNHRWFSSTASAPISVNCYKLG